MNKVSNRKSTKGITNIELMMALVVASVIIMMGFRQVQNYMFKKNVTIIDTSVKLLLTAGQKYYFANCSSLASTSSKALNIRSDLESGLYLANAGVIQNPFDAANSMTSYTVTLIKSTTAEAKWNVEVKFTFPSTMSADKYNSYAAALSPSEQNANVLTWIQNVKSTGRTSASELSPMVQDIERFSTERTIKNGYSAFKPPNSQNPCVQQ